MNHKMSGIMIVEVIISMTLGLIIVAALVEVSLMLKQLWLMQQGMCRIQENARMIDTLLGGAIKNNNYFGCHALSDNISIRIHQGIDANYFGLSSHWPLSGDKSKISLDNAVPGSDVLWLRSFKTSLPLIENTSGEHGYFLVQGKAPIKKGRLIAISDCSHIDVLKVEGRVEPVEKGMIKIYPKKDEGSIALSKYYQAGAQVGMISSSLYYVTKTKRTNTSGIPVFALYTLDLNGRKREWVEGVEYISILYGVMSKDVIQYFNASQVKDWKSVVSVKARILLDSIEDALPKPQPYDINEQAIIPDDRMLRKWVYYEWAIKA
ncbi:MAG: PilW family protein [Candidatus Berkiellales bacterium]